MKQARCAVALQLGALELSRAPTGGHFALDSQHDVVVPHGGVRFVEHAGQVVREPTEGKVHGRLPLFEGEL